MHIIGGTFKNHPIIAPKGAVTRPTSSRLRETVFNICQNYIEEARFLDLFAGSGGVGLEALSRGASFCVFADQDRNSQKSIQANLEEMKLTNRGRVIGGNLFTWLEKNQGKESYRIIYADPPYDAKIQVNGRLISYSEHILALVDQSSFLESEGVLFIEDSTAFKPDLTTLSQMVLVSQRRSGRSNLWQFSRQNASSKNIST